MPELPEIEVIKRQLRTSGVLTKTVDRVTNMGLQLRKPVPLLDVLIGSSLVTIERRAKYLGFVFSNGKTLISHLGMSGMWNLMPHEGRLSELANKHRIIVFHLDQSKHGRCILAYSDPRRFGCLELIDSIAAGQFFEDKWLGVEPLKPEFTADILYGLLSEYTGNIKQFLMDQTQVCGLGNIYANEVLFRCQLYPGYLASGLTVKAPALHREITEVLAQAIEHGGSTIHSFSSLTGQGSAQRFHLAYGREGLSCLRSHCQGTIRKSGQFDSRSSYFCSVCQAKRDVFA